MLIAPPSMSLVYLDEYIVSESIGGGPCAKVAGVYTDADGFRLCIG